MTCVRPQKSCSPLLPRPLPSTTSSSSQLNRQIPHNLWLNLDTQEERESCLFSRRWCLQDGSGETQEEERRSSDCSAALKSCYLYPGCKVSWWVQIIPSNLSVWSAIILVKFGCLLRRSSFPRPQRSLKVGETTDWDYRWWGRNWQNWTLGQKQYICHETFISCSGFADPSSSSKDKTSKSREKERKTSTSSNTSIPGSPALSIKELSLSRSKYSNVDRG